MPPIPTFLLPVTPLTPSSRRSPLIHSTKPPLLTLPTCTLQTPPQPQDISTTPTTRPTIRGTTTNPYTIALLPGDGHGPTTTASTVRMLEALSQITDVHFKFSNLPMYSTDNGSVNLDKAFLEECKGGDGVCLRGAAGVDRKRGVELARGLMNGLGLCVQLRPGTTYEWQGVGGWGDVKVGMDVMLVREVGGGAMSFGYNGNSGGGGEDEFKGLDEMSSVIRYGRKEIRDCVEWAVRIAGMRGGRLVNVDKADAMKVSRFWRSVVHETFKEVVPNRDGITLMDMYVDDFVREVILYPQGFDTVVTSNLFGDLISEAIASLAGPARIAPAAWLAADGTAVYGPADVYNPSAYGEGATMEGDQEQKKSKSTVANMIAMYRAASMLLRYSLEEPGPADLIQNALNKVMMDLMGRQERGQVEEEDRYIMNGGGGTVSHVDNSIDRIDAETFESEFVNQLNYIRQYEHVCDPGECGE